MSVEIEIAVAIDGVAVQGIVGTFEVAVLIIGMTGPIQWVKVEATDEAYPFSDERFAMYISHMGLRDGFTAFGAIVFRIQRIDEIDITVVSHGEILYLE